MQNNFENKTCSRCSGSGKHSQHGMYGKVCFKCNGKGFVLTARGKRQLEKYETLCSRFVSEIVPGNIILDNTFGKWYVVKSVVKINNFYDIICNNGMTFSQMGINNILKVKLTILEQKEAFDIAIKVK